jgi:hypothetical protein
MTRHLDLRKPPRVVFRPLGKERAHGQAHVCPSNPAQRGLIEIDPRLRGRRLLEVAIHEMLHQIFPAMGEEDVRRAGRWIALSLWAWGVRLDEDDMMAIVGGDDPEAV